MGITLKSNMNSQCSAVRLCTSPPLIRPTCNVVQGGVNTASSGRGALANCVAFTSFAQPINRAASMIALTPSCIIEECTGKPFTTIRKPRLPLCPVTGFIIEGSPTITASARGNPLAAKASIIGGAPKQPISSS